MGAVLVSVAYASYQLPPSYHYGPKHRKEGHSHSANTPQMTHCLGEEEMMSVTSSSCEGRILSYTLNCLPNRGICSINTGGALFSFTLLVLKLWSNKSCTVGTTRSGSFSTKSW